MVHHTPSLLFLINGVFSTLTDHAEICSVQLDITVSSKLFATPELLRQKAIQPFRQKARALFRSQWLLLASRRRHDQGHRVYT